jgi:AraC family transcriptional regulator, chitin signaling transcriptional activator
LKPTKPLYFLFLYLLCFYLKAQERPPVQVYSPTDYGAENQNWSISQSKEKYIYVANNKGLLEFNGAKWQLYQSPNQTIIRSVNVIDDYIYTGSNSDFGYWQKNNLGLLYYTSLSKELKVKFLEDEEFWNIISIDDYILFQSLKRIYVYNKINKSFMTIDSETIIYKMFKVDDSIYFQKTKEGIYRIENGKSVLVSDNDILKNNRLVNIFSQNGNLLVETENDGFYIIENNNFYKWDINANETLSKISVFRSIQLNDGSFILGTRSNGIYHLTKNGDINYNIDVIHGLGNNTVHGLFEDIENNIWLALENGINCININSPFSIYEDNEGRLGTVYTSTVYSNILYLGTNQGLFYKQLDLEEEFKVVEGVKEAVWCLVEINNTLFCGHDTGTSIINHNVAEKINRIQQGTWNIKPFKNNNLLLGTYNGLYIIEKVDDKWVFKNKIKGFDVSSKFFEIYDNHIFVSHEYKGVFKLSLNDDLTNFSNIYKYPENGKELKSSILSYNNNLLYTNKEGVFTYNSEQDKFLKDPILSRLFKKNEYTSGKLILNPNRNILWAFSKKKLSYISPDKISNNLKVNEISYSESLPIGLTGYENISYLNDQKYLLGTTNGFIKLDLDKVKNKSYNISINSITKHTIKKIPEIVNKSKQNIFKNKYNNLTFNYSVPEFEKYLDTEYQYHVEGLYPDWSNWSTNSTTLLENLPHGDYVFKVRARVGNNISKNIETFSFSIERPWYLVNLMILVYFLLVTLFSIFMHHVYKRYYKKQREKLLQKTTQELALKELENKQQFMRFNNDKLRQDIESKNRELATSTMSLIKKNEFLNSIKNELLNIEGNKQVKNVLKIIDRNINNSDDWNTFEEAFNNADKDFLKKIKAEHPSLTPNDLRLCAYLRLNLSSKEIAPLLNISARSVEVKRYRLRKKMNLQHESSLTDYILEV